MQLWSKTEREEALEYKYKCHLNREDGLKSSTLQMTESICLITTKCFHKTAQSPLSWETTKAVPSPWKPVLLAHYRSATIDAKAGRIWALCVLGDTRGYVTVKGIGIPLTLSEKLASPRKRTVPKLNKNKASLHRTVSHLLAEYSGFEATMMEMIRNPKHQSKQNERDTRKY